jgi:hypothetical protein
VKVRKIIVVAEPLTIYADLLAVLAYTGQWFHLPVFEEI